MAQIEFTQRVKFFICILHIRHLIYKPSIPIDVRVLDCHRLISLKRHYKVFSVQHVQYREEAISIDFSHVSACLCDGRHHLLHLRTNVSIYQFLVSSELSCMISAYTFMVIRGFILVESVAGKIQNAII